MKANEVLKLIDAGFSADEIRTMLTIEPEQAPAEPAAIPEPAPAPAAPAAPAEPAQPGLDAITAFNTLMGRLNDKLDAIQRANLINDASSGGASDPSADDIISELIYPGSKNT